MNRKDLRDLRKQLAALVMKLVDLVFVIDRILREQEEHQIDKAIEELSKEWDEEEE